MIVSSNFGMVTLLGPWERHEAIITPAYLEAGGRNDLCRQYRQLRASSNTKGSRYNCKDSPLSVGKNIQHNININSSGCQYLLGKQMFLFIGNPGHTI